MATISQALARRHVQAVAKLYIKNTSGTWVDFTDRWGEDRLVGMGRIVHRAMNAMGRHATTRAIEITLDNTDRYWDKAPPSAFDPWQGRDVQIRLDIADASEQDVVTMRIAPDGITTDTGNNARMKLEPLTETLARVDAASIKQGQDWYQMRPWLYLAGEMIRTEFGDSSGDLPAGYSIPTDPRWTYPDSAKHLSAFGHPPQWDGTDWNEDNTDTPFSLCRDSSNDLLYVGIGADLWKYDVAADTWENLGEDATVGTGEQIRAVYLCDTGVVVLKWSYDFTSPYEQTLYVTFYDTGADQWDTTTRATYTDFFPGEFWVYNGAWFTGIPGESDHQTRGWYQATARGGTHVAVPFFQRLRENQSGGSPEYRTPAVDLASLTDTAAVGDSHDPMPVTFPEGYAAIKSTTNAALELQVAYGNKPNVAFLNWNGTPVDCYIYIVRYNSGAGTWNAYILGISQGSAITATANLSTAESYPMHSLTLDTGDSKLRWVRFDENPDATGYDTTQVCAAFYTSPPNTTSVELSNYVHLNDNTDIITDFVKATTGNWVLVLLKAARVRKFPQFELVHHTGSVLTVLDASMGYFITPREEVTTWPAFYIDTQSGALKKITYTAGTPDPPALMDSGLPPVFDAPFCADFRYDSGSDPDIFGLSFPFHLPETQEATPEGKYYLWQYTSQHSGRVELADFADLSKLDALAKLCEAHRHEFGVDRSGNWIVQELDPATASAATVGPDLFDKGWVSIKRLASADIVNFVEITPHESRLKPMESTLQQRPLSVFDGVVYASQLDTSKRRVRFRCIHGGMISTGETRWDLLVFKEIIQTRLGAAYVSGTTVTLESVWDIAIGDTIEVSDSASRTVVAVSAAAGTVTIDSGFASGYVILSPVKITKINDQSWSSEGVTLLDEASGINSSVTSFDVDNADDIAVGNFIVIDSEEMEVTAKSGVTLTVTRGDNAASHSDNATVAMIVKPGGLSTATLVGNQGISVRFESNSATETPIAAGDFVEFVCPGLVLEEVKQSRIIAADDTSIGDNGKRKPRERIANRFLSSRLAEFFAQDIVTRYATEKRRWELEMPIDFDYFTGSVFTLKTEDMLPDETSNELDVIVRDVTDAPVRSRRTTYVLEEQ